MIQLETKEAGTGIWFPIIQYFPGTVGQQTTARGIADTLRTAFGLHAIVTGDPISTQEGTK